MVTKSEVVHLSDVHYVAMLYDNKLTYVLHNIDTLYNSKNLFVI